MPVPGTRRVTALVFVAGLFPVPFVDTLLQNAVRRRFVASVSESHGLGLTPAEIQALADQSLAPGKRLVFYGLKKVLGRLLWPVAVVGAVSQVRTTLGLGDRVLASRAVAAPPVP
jgi:hypothetical protein